MSAARKKKGQSKYCRISQYIKANDESLADLFANNCVEHHLAPRANGVTFLYPAEDAYRKEILSQDDSEMVVKMLDSLIIPICLKNAAEWKGGPVGSFGNPGVLYKVKSASASTVTLEGEKGDVKLEKEDNFDTLSTARGSMAVWRIASGRLPTSGAAFSVARPSRHAERKEKKGGGENSAQAGRALLGGAVREQYCRELCRDRAASEDPYLRKVAGLLCYLKASRPALYAAVRPLVDWDSYITFHILVEPYKTSGSHLIPDGVMFGENAWNGIDAMGEPAKILRDAMDREAKDVGRAVRAVDEVRRSVTAAANKVTTPKNILAAYEKLVGNGDIAGLKNVLPADTRNLLTGAKKLWQDEFRFLVHTKLSEVRAAPAASLRDEWRMLNDDVCLLWPGNDYARELQLANADDLSRIAVPDAAFAGLMKFVESTDFLYLGVPEAKVGGAAGDPEDLSDHTVYNRNHAANAALQRQNMKARVGVSDAALAEIKAYHAAFGELPPALKGLK